MKLALTATPSITLVVNVVLPVASSGTLFANVALLAGDVSSTATLRGGLPAQASPSLSSIPWSRSSIGL
ncbi:hypothetical protein PF005_g218 [Phytophthora fragariae]|uniref:Uncharacterized protein n=1 Tax=Phytophthora fragariae TaxID=53985 RepID=A0A6A3FYV6_9STRA|nr:hypothetical protein PF009_g442 [Phytophthora fragariae]KAE9140356.1 hypothetical protein PF010_g214 [Phytophthora fragariae]KAE9238423.1 hypothetical protein PF005_g218 [Phytophthora fragariae]KAE9256198.1 hypothetical protein PF004_g233 [Phytophthora fragariae]KAE9258219.1 hypothetical protein PF002_g307 [Phytophthora fragariae]